ncbi:MAG TPA: hypothetical protein VD962_04345 [Rubricoccaceae bacterium]|nr:hypothetical protein [Rubricoccaceae bacterium]
MAAILDHLVAIIVGAVLILALVVVQQRSKQRAVETTIHTATQAQTLSFMDAFERDVENMRTREAMGTFYQCVVEQDGGMTTRFTFPTLARPDSGQASRPALVTYRREPTGRVLQVNGVARPLYRLARLVATPGRNWAYAGGSTEIITDFDVALTPRGGAPITSGNCPDNLERVRVEATTGRDGVVRTAGDQYAAGRMNLSRSGLTIVPFALGQAIPPNWTPPVEPPPATLPPVPEPTIEDVCPDQPGTQPPGTICTPDGCPEPGWQAPGSCIDACPEQPGQQPYGTSCVPDACPLEPGWQAPGTTCRPDACPEPGWQAPGTTCVDACPEPGYQPYGSTCRPDGCPEPGWQAPGSTCTPDACPDPGWQAPGTTCPDACPQPGHQPYGTACTPDACPDPGWQAPGTRCLDACTNLPGYQAPGTPCYPPDIR